ncbi:unnamed protein product [Brachionus calyciflorus]|uniref:Uncharacterized protein n=1 Tax=Brachionus calyciflorus TaxID=104777 RepID=A0A813R201_9BILA|nr:unnamed protein product [Brachionus calyciflorus]
MRIFDKKLKLILFGFCMFFLGYFSLNFADLVHINNRKRLIEIKPFEASSELNSFEKFEIYIPKENLTTKVISKKVTRYIAYDSGGFGSINQGIVHCSDDLEVQITDSAEQIKNADFLYFHMNAPDKLKYAQNQDKKQYIMVYTMESEVSIFKFLTKYFQLRINKKFITQ